MNDATNRKTPRKMTARNCVITISTMTHKNYEYIIVTQS
jgi:hypothetical protein